MYITKEELHKLINELPEQEIPTVSKFIKFVISDYKKLIEPLINEENIEVTFEKLIEQIASCSTGGNSVDDVRMERE